MFNDIYQGKKVLVTGHTGFKGSWLCAWLTQLGAKVCGFSFSIPTEPSHYEALNLKKDIQEAKADVRQITELSRVFKEFEPDMVFHLSAQPLVHKSYQDPLSTFEINIMGTTNILECIRKCATVRVGLIITSDKCYRNFEWNWGYRENDRLGGEDPYSASKACAELVTYSYIHSFFEGTGVQVATARAGNVIGGGDWAANRVVPDAMKAWSQKKPVILRDPKASRPWQHVLEPLSGYLWLGAQLWENNPCVVDRAFNFGPGTYVNQTVEELISSMSGFWPQSRWQIDPSSMNGQKEHEHLKLCCDQALSQLNWKVTLSFEETVAMTVDWYRTFYEKGNSALPDLTYGQIADYVVKARQLGQPWAQSKMEVSPVK